MSKDIFMTVVPVALIAIASALIAQTLMIGPRGTPPPTVAMAPAPLSTDAVKGAVLEVLDAEGLTGKALDQKMEKAIIAFIKSRAQDAPNEAAPQPGTPAPSASADVTPIDPAREPVAGNAGARYQLIVYSDFECPFCQRFDPTLKTLIERYGDRLAVTQRDFPLSFHGQAAVDEARAAACVFDLGGNEAFWSYSHAIFAATGSNGRGLGEGGLKQQAVKLGVNPEAFEHCLSSDTGHAKIARDQQSGAAAGVRGTPTSFIYDTQTGRSATIRGAQPLSAVASALDNLLAGTDGAGQ